jgi:hypothetical protein
MENEKKGPQDPRETDDLNIFKNALEIEAYLTAPPRNWKVKKSSIYNHIKARKLIAEADGTFTMDEVERYAMANLRKADGTTLKTARLDKVAFETADHRRRREKAQARISEIKVDMLEGSLVPQDAFEDELAGRAVIFRSDLENLFRSKSSDIIALVAGDQMKTPDLMAWGINEIEAILARYLQEEEFKVDPSAYEKLFSLAAKDEEEEDEENDNG